LFLTSLAVVSVSRTTSAVPSTPRHHDLFHSPVGQLVGQLVFRMTTVALDPLPLHMVLTDQLIQLTPEIGILHRLAASGFPAALLPVGHPLADALHYILRVGGQPDIGRGLLQGLQTADGRHQLHAVIGGLRLAAEQGLLIFAQTQQYAPAARAGIALAGAVGKYLDYMRHVLSRLCARRFPATSGGRPRAGKAMVRCRRGMAPRVCLR